MVGEVRCLRHPPPACRTGPQLNGLNEASAKLAWDNRLLQDAPRLRARSTFPQHLRAHCSLPGISSEGRGLSFAGSGMVGSLVPVVVRWSSLSGTRRWRLRRGGCAEGRRVSLTAPRGRFTACCNDESSDSQCNTDRHYRDCGTGHLTRGAGLVRQRHLGRTTVRQELDQAISNYLAICVCPSTAGQSRDQ
jgi:hypothetical protein